MELSTVNFEQAKALKELGFPQETDSWNYYDITGKCVSYLQKGGHKEHCCDAPSLELVAKWLREEKYIFINVLKVSKDGYTKCDVIYNKGTNNSHCEYEYLETWDNALSWGIDTAIEKLKTM